MSAIGPYFFVSTSPSRVAYAALTARSYHARLAVALMDGSVRTIGDDVDLRVWRAAGTRRGGEALPVP